MRILFIPSDVDLHILKSFFIAGNSQQYVRFFGPKMADSYLPNENEMFGDDDNADDNSLLNFSSKNEHLDFLDLDACDQNVSFWAESIPPTQDAQDEPPAVLEQAADEPPPSNSANDTRAPPQPSKLDWEKQKANIIALYRDHKAKELPRIMQDRHGFYAR